MSPPPPLTDPPKLSLKKLCRITYLCSSFYPPIRNHLIPTYDEIPTKPRDFVPLLENSLKSLQMLKPSLMLQ